MKVIAVMEEISIFEKTLETSIEESSSESSSVEEFYIKKDSIKINAKKR